MCMLLSTKKSTIFRIINQQLKFCAIFFSKINPDVHVSTKINTFTFYKGVQRNEKNGGFTFLHQIIQTRRVDSPVMKSVQIIARGRGGGSGGILPGFCFIKMVQCGAF